MPESSSNVEPAAGMGSSCPAVRMVIQRYRHAKLLLDEKKVISLGAPLSSMIETDGNLKKDDSTRLSTAGVLVYISFAKTATQAKAEQAVKTLLNLPVLTLGAWGDGSGTKSIFQLSADVHGRPKDEPKTPSLDDNNSGDVTHQISHVSVLLVPQANLTSKVKKLGKSIQYRDQIAKSDGEALYYFFAERVEQLLIEHHAAVQNGGGFHLGNAGGSSSDTMRKKQNNQSTPDPSIPPSRLFHQDDTYGAFEEDNDQTFPLTYANGEPLSKSARKKLQKIYNVHVQRHAKYLERQATSGNSGGNGSGATNDDANVGDSDPRAVQQQNETPARKPYTKNKNILDPSFVQLVAGSFGKRQALELQSDMGPFCHVIEID